MLSAMVGTMVEWCRIGPSMVKYAAGLITRKIDYCVDDYFTN